MAGLSITKMPAQIVLPKPIIVACKSPSSLLKLIRSSPAERRLRLLYLRRLHDFAKPNQETILVLKPFF
jgi:hypothetical protein